MKKIQKNPKIKQIMSIFLVFCMVLTLGSGIVHKAETKAADAAFENSIAAFPDSYKPYLRTLHTKYPSWKFVAYNTGLNFATVVNKEFADDKSLIENSFSKLLKSNGSVKNYNASTGTYIPKDGGTWVAASKNCIAYFVDPRNFLNETHIYMFEQLSFDAATQTQAGVEAILEGSFMYNKAISYINTAGKYISTDILYSAQIMEAAKTYNVSAYYLASKIIQEIGTGANAKYAGMGSSGSVSGTYSQAYTGIYNFYNIGATSGGSPIANGLSWASGGSTYGRPWNTPAKSINGGAQYIGEKYINCGQNTTYYQRFNVNNASTYALYSHQYMTNIYGAANEASFTKNAYEELGIAGLAKTFVIPVYTNMPAEGNRISYGNTSTQGTVASSVNVRNQANTTGQIVTTLKQGDIVTVHAGVMTNLQFDSKWLSNPYWYKISIEKDGKKYEGYVSATYININREYSMVKGSTMTVPISLGTNDTVYYRSDNPAVAKVNTSGTITAKAGGLVTIYAFTPTGNYAATAVQVFANGCTLSPEKISLNVGEPKKLTTTVYPANAVDKSVKYESSNKAVATVTSKGKVKAKGPGTAIITATAAVGGAQGKCTVRVIQPVTGVSLNKKSLNLTVGQKQKLQATVKPAKASDKTVTWSSANRKVAKVSKKGKVTAVSAGTVNITAKSNNGKTAVCKVKVKPAKVLMTGKSRDYQSVKLSWPAAANLTGYYLYRKNSAGKYVKIATLPGTATSYVHQSLTTGRKQSYKIAAYRTVGKTIYKSAKSSVVTVTPIPKKTKILLLEEKGAGVKIQWSKIKKSSGYEIYRKDNLNKKYKKVKTVKGNSKFTWTNRKLQAGKTYYYKILVYRKVSGKKIYSKYSKVKKIEK